MKRTLVKILAAGVILLTFTGCKKTVPLGQGSIENSNLKSSVSRIVTEEVSQVSTKTIKNTGVCDENNYICLASSSLPKGTIVDTPFGKRGKVYDCGCLSYILDVYVSWY